MCEPEWTRIRPSLKQKSIIDYIITDVQLLEVSGNVHVDGTDIGSSDHFLVWMELGQSSKGLFTSNSLQCALKRIWIECTSNPDSIHFGTFHITNMKCALSNRIITQSALCVLYIESNSVSQHGDAPGYFKIVLVFCHSVIRLHYKHKLARERRKYMAKKRAEKRRKLLFKKETAVP